MFWLISHAFWSWFWKELARRRNTAAALFCISSFLGWPFKIRMCFFTSIYFEIVFGIENIWSKSKCFSNHYQIYSTFDRPATVINHISRAWSRERPETCLVPLIHVPHLFMCHISSSPCANTIFQQLFSHISICPCANIIFQQCSSHISTCPCATIIFQQFSSHVSTCPCANIMFQQFSSNISTCPCASINLNIFPAISLHVQVPA